MDQKEFERRLAEVARFSQVRMAQEYWGTKNLSDEEPMTIRVECVLPEQRRCEWCTQSCSSYMNHWRTWNQRDQVWTWHSSCGTCKKNVNVKTGEVGYNKKFVKQNLRTPSPGKKLGRPAKPRNDVQGYAEYHALIQKQIRAESK